MVERFRTNYLGHDLDIKRQSNGKYTGTSTFLNGKWNHEDYSVDFIVKRHQIEIDRIVEHQKKILGTTYEDIWKEWKGKTKVVTYKDWKMLITAIKRAKDNRVLYIGEFNKDKGYFPKKTSIKSINYDKVVSRFQRFVDEYCTDWVDWKEYEYKGYKVIIKGERTNSNSFFGSVQFHKNSIFKCIASSTREIQQLCDSRIERVVNEKEKVKMLTPKQEKIQELEQLQARISAQLEELKNEKETWIYKGIVLEYGTDEELEKGYSVGRIKDAPRGTQEFYGKIEDVIKTDLEDYIDELEKSANLYCLLTGKEFSR